MVRKARQNWWLVIIGLALVPLAVTVWEKTPEIRHWLNPVLERVEPVDVVRDGDRITWRVTGNKARGCKLDAIEFSSQVDTPHGRRWIRLEVLNAKGEPVGPNPNVGVGPFNLGPFSTTLAPAQRSDTHIDSVLFYDCDGERAPASFGRFEIPRPE